MEEGRVVAASILKGARMGQGVQAWTRREICEVGRMARL